MGIFIHSSLFISGCVNWFLCLYQCSTHFNFPYIINNPRLRSFIQTQRNCPLQITLLLPCPLRLLPIFSWNAVGGTRWKLSFDHINAPTLKLNKKITFFEWIWTFGIKLSDIEFQKWFGDHSRCFQQRVQNEPSCSNFAKCKPMILEMANVGLCHTKMRNLCGLNTNWNFLSQ